eukprot:g1197.t1
MNSARYWTLDKPTLIKELEELRNTNVALEDFTSDCTGRISQLERRSKENFLLRHDQVNALLIYLKQSTDREEKLREAVGKLQKANESLSNRVVHVQDKLKSKLEKERTSSFQDQQESHHKKSEYIKTLEHERISLLAENARLRMLSHVNATKYQKEMMKCLSLEENIARYDKLLSKSVGLQTLLNEEKKSATKKQQEITTLQNQKTALEKEKQVQMRQFKRKSSIGSLQLFAAQQKVSELQEICEAREERILDLEKEEQVLLKKLSEIQIVKKNDTEQLLEALQEKTEELDDANERIKNLQIRMKKEILRVKAEMEGETARLVSRLREETTLKNSAEGELQQATSKSIVLSKDLSRTMSVKFIRNILVMNNVTKLSRAWKKWIRMDSAILRKQEKKEYQTRLSSYNENKRHMLERIIVLEELISKSPDRKLRTNAIDHYAPAFHRLTSLEHDVVQRGKKCFVLLNFFHGKQSQLRTLEKAMRKLAGNRKRSNSSSEQLNERIRRYDITKDAITRKTRHLLVLRAMIVGYIAKWDSVHQAFLKWNLNDLQKIKNENL